MATTKPHEVPAIEVWTNNKGELVEGIIEYGWFDALDDVQEVISIIKATPQKAVFMRLYGFNLVTLRGAFNV
jgi:hypothetical protein